MDQTAEPTDRPRIADKRRNHSRKRQRAAIQKRDIVGANHLQNIHNLLSETLSAPEREFAGGPKPCLLSPPWYRAIAPLTLTPPSRITVPCRHRRENPAFNLRGFQDQEDATDWKMQPIPS